jgi:hexosaminidase
MSLHKGSYGPPYTLMMNVSAPFKLSGPDTTLSLASISANDTTSMALTFTTADNFPYPLRSTSLSDGLDPGHPGRIWTNQSSSTHDVVAFKVPANLRIESDVVNGTRVWVNEKFAGRFEVFVYGGRNTLFSWSHMALVAPLEMVDGGVDGLRLEAGVGMGKSGASNGGAGMPVSSGMRRRATGGYARMGLTAGIMVSIVFWL